MRKILSDHDVEGQVEHLFTIWSSSDWIELWQWLGYNVETFRSLGLPRDILDSELWKFCQANEIVLITGNRNADGEDALEVTIERFNQSDSLPVLTIGDADRVIFDREYAQRVASQIVDFLFDLDSVRGAGRLYVP